MLHLVIRHLGLKSKSHGKGDHRYLVLSRSTKSRGFDVKAFESFEKSIRRRFFARTDTNLAGRSENSRVTATSSGSQSVKLRPGDKVGEGAPELGSGKGSAKAKAMMERMGWTTGQALGSNENKGILNPIEQVVWYSRAGLG